MKLLNLFSFDAEIGADQFNQFIREHYRYIDIVAISTQTLLEEIQRLGFKSEDLFKAVFGNEYWKTQVEVVCTPELVTEIYLYISENGESVKNSFLDICYHYGIVVFLTDLFESNCLPDDLPKWTSCDDHLMVKVLSNRHYLVNCMAIFDDNLDFYMRKYNYLDAKEQLAKTTIKSITADLELSIDSLNYFYDDLIG